MEGKGIGNIVFRRRFGINPYKTLRMKLGEMSCAKDWLSDTRGDPYPAVYHSGAGLRESLPGGAWRIANAGTEAAAAARLLGCVTPCATYELTLRECGAGSSAGFRFAVAADGVTGFTERDAPAVTVTCTPEDGRIRIACICEKDGRRISEGAAAAETAFRPGMRMSVYVQEGWFCVYLRCADDAYPRPVRAFEVPEMRVMQRTETALRTAVSAYAAPAPGEAVACNAAWYLDAGGSQADIKCMRFEDGSPVTENGRLFLTLSVREMKRGYQAVVSWDPSSADMRMEGALFFDYGDGWMCGDVASSAVYDRSTGMWYVWACAFSHGHILCGSACRADLRHGIHILDAVLADIEDGTENAGLRAGTGVTLSDDRLFLGKCGDEDPDLMFDPEIGKWRLIVCRLDASAPGHAYRYFMFVSDDPLKGFAYVSRTAEGNETGGSVVRMGGRLFLMCGSDFSARAVYHMHPLDDLAACTRLCFDYDDGGFRGWGTLIPVPCGTRTKYLLLTFDRHNAYDGKWTYGNLYVFEADRMAYGYEWGGGLPALPDRTAHPLVRGIDFSRHV